MQRRKSVAFSGIHPHLSLQHLVSPAAMALATATSSARYKVNILARSNHASRTEKQKVVLSCRFCNGIYHNRAVVAEIKLNDENTVKEIRKVTI